MNIFDLNGAKYFCTSFSPSHPNQSLKAHNRALRSCTAREGSTEFDKIRTHLLRDVERSLFLAASQYIRSFDLMLASSASWTYVTLYYGSFYAAQALLGMFGGWIDSPYMLIHVTNPAPGNQELRVQRDPQYIPASHKGFWMEFYDAFNTLQIHINPQLRFAVQPISGQDSWLIDHRNDFNYDTYMALHLGDQFDRSFSESGFPSCLPGEMNTQFLVTKALTTLAFSFARAFNLSTGALDMIGSTAVARRSKIRNMVLGARRPQLSSKINPAIVLA